ncbi:epsilon subunit of F1F0-ATP synthase N-terminal domain-containing protein, partial [Aureobasidium melanogenum]
MLKIKAQVQSSVAETVGGQVNAKKGRQSRKCRGKSRGLDAGVRDGGPTSQAPAPADIVQLTNSLARPPLIMNSFRVARAALRVRPTAFAAPLARRGYADVASDKIQLSLSLPHQAIYKSQDVVQVNIPAETGDMGVLASHVPSIEQLRPGLVEVIEESAGSKQFFLSGGFATVQPGSKLSINAVEGFPLEDFSAEAVRNQIAEAQKIASGSGSEQDIAEAKIELEVLESLQAFLK